MNCKLADIVSLREGFCNLYLNGSFKDSFPQLLWPTSGAVTEDFWGLIDAVPD